MNECNIVKDLLPLYADELVSPDSVEFIDRHTENCPACRQIWRRYKGELPQTHPPMPEQRAEDYQNPLKKGVRKIALSTIFYSLLLIALMVGLYLYPSWEYGRLAKGKAFPSPDGARSIEIASLEYAGFFDNDGYVVRFDFPEGVNHYYPHWQDLQVYWAGDSHTSLLEITTSDGNLEYRIVNQPETPSGGTWEIPGLTPSENEPDLIPALTELCREKKVTVADWEEISFRFTRWDEDCKTISFRYETDTGETGFVNYHFPTQTLTGQFQ